MSGMAALYSDITYTAMPTSLALGGPDISMGLLQPSFLRENYADTAVGVLGAGPSISDIGRGVVDLVSEYGEGAKQIMRSMPLADCGYGLHEWSK